jgi:hypothetical protein
MWQARDQETLAKNTQRVVKHLYDEALVIPIIIDTSIVAASDKVHDLGFFKVHIVAWTPWNAWIEH